MCLKGGQIGNVFLERRTKLKLGTHRVHKAEK
jgi:hypothetical protein